MFSMPANLGIVGYARVKMDGSTPNINSGLTITRIGMGQYNIVLPGAPPPPDEPLQEGQQVAHQDLIFITPLLTLPPPAFCISDEPNDYTRVVLFTNTPSTQSQDTEFDILVLRTVLSAPLDANGNQTAPI